MSSLIAEVHTLESPKVRARIECDGGYVFPGLDLARHEPSPPARSDCSIEISFLQLARVAHTFISGIFDTVAVLLASPIWH